MVEIVIERLELYIAYANGLIMSRIRGVEIEKRVICQVKLK